MHRSRLTRTAMMRCALAAALVACAACDDSGSAAPPADLSAVADQARPADLASSVSDGGLPAACATASGGDACDPATQYCAQCLCGDPVRHGAGRPNAATGCVALPAACAATPTCACVLANSAQSGCTCTTFGAQVVVTCVGP